MKTNVQVWIRKNIAAPGDKCIFIGEVSSIPAQGSDVVVKDGFASKAVKLVTHDFSRGVVIINLAGDDYENEYGPCLMYGG